MTNTAIPYAPLPPAEARNLFQRLQAADTAWREFVAQQSRLTAASHAQEQDNATTFVGFSRFIHELIPDRQLRWSLLKAFEGELNHMAGAAR